MLKSMRNSKKSLFYHIFVSPRDAPGAITLNVVWMEREFDAYKLPRCMCPSNYKTISEIERDICEKIVILAHPLHSTLPLGGFPSEYCHAVCYRKTRMLWLPDGKKNLKICLFVLTQCTNMTDTQTDRHRMTA